ncbi:MAG: protein phosphatase 2C domain-containing protein [Ktedonobacterales bacterium]|nr:protein phosphatase 2C domain-containing protein [Ktedonobacterales bacterium]
MPALAHARAPQPAPRPREFVATAQLAVVRLIAAYYAQTTTGPAPTLTPLEPCTGLGAIVGTTGVGGNARHYVLTDAHLVSPVQPCSSAQAAYLNANHTLPAGWKLTKVTAYLDSAYTGGDAAHLGTLAFDLDISALPTLGLSEGAIVLPLAASTAPTYDLPVVVVPASPPTGTTQVLDLGGTDATPYTSDAITLNALPGALTVSESVVALPPSASVPTPVPTVSATLSPTTPTPLTLSLTPAPTPLINPGAPLITDVGAGGGQLSGMVLTTAQGLRVVGTDALNAALRAAFAVSNAGAFNGSWHSALDDYYAASATNPKDARYQSATAQLQSLRDHYPSFTGVTPWLMAAASGSPLPGVAIATASGSSDEIIPGLPVHGLTQFIAFLLAIAIVLLGLFLLVRVAVMRRSPRAGLANVARASYADDGDITQKTPALTLQGGAVRGDTTVRPTMPLSGARRVIRYGLQASGLTDPGMRRKADPNQDSILVVQGARMHQHAPQPFGLFVVADGMGGHQFGREASSETVRVMADHILQPLLGGESFDDAELLDLLRQGAQHANETLHYRNVRQHADMGTTVTAALVAGDMAYIINVGDSRTYHLQTEMPLRQVTADHSVVASLVAAGVIQPDDVYTHPKRNQIFRSLGEQEDAQIDTFTVPVKPGDHLLLCSDGLWEMIRNPRIEALLRHHRDLTALTQALVDEANDNGGVDNISAVVVRVLGEDAAPQQVGMHVLVGPTAPSGS